MIEHVRCSKCQAWLRFRSDPIFGRVWQECDCGVVKLARRLPSEVDPEKVKRCRCCAGPISAGRVRYCSDRCANWQHKSTAKVVKLAKERDAYLAKDRQHAYSRRGPKDTHVPTRAAIPHRWG